MPDRSVFGGIVRYSNLSDATARSKLIGSRELTYDRMLDTHRVNMYFQPLDAAHLHRLLQSS